MGRPTKTGISFFAMDSNWIQDDKIQLLFDEHGGDAFWIWSCLISKIYSENGYYVDFSNKISLILFAKKVCYLPIEKVSTVINSCCEYQLFDLEIYTKYQILTSRRIQYNYLYATKDKRNHNSSIYFKPELLLVDTLNEKNIVFEYNTIPQQNSSNFDKKTVENSYSQNNPSFSENNWDFSQNNPDYSQNVPVNSGGKVPILYYIRLDEKKREDSVCVIKNMVDIKREPENIILKEENITHTHRLNIFIKEKYKSILEIPNQMTSFECEELKNLFSNEIIKKAIEQLDNKPKGKYQKVFNTLKLFCEGIKPANNNGTAKPKTPLIPVRSPYKAISIEEALIREAEKKKKLKDDELPKIRGSTSDDNLNVGLVVLKDDCNKDSILQAYS